MKLRLILTIIQLFTYFFLFSQNTGYSKNEILVKLKKNQHTQDKFENYKLQKLAKQYDVKEYKSIGNKNLNNTYCIKFEQIDLNITEIINSYLATNLFEFVEPNYIGYSAGVRQTIPNDANFYNRQWGLFNDGTFTLSNSTNDADIDMDLAWDIQTGDPNLIVAILDSGLRINHPEFNGRIWQNLDESSNGVDSDSNGFVDDILCGWDFANEDNDPTDDQGHGTNVTGIALASGNNNIGYAGVNWQSKVMMCKILDDNNSGFYSWWVDAIYYAVDNGAKVINMSVGGSGFSSAMQDAVDYAYTNGVTIVACMMNYDNDTTYYPAGYANTIAVGSTDSDDTRTSPFFWSASSGSNFGNHIDVIAPGNYIYGLSYSSDTNYNSYWGGTSQATPLVTGLVSLLLSENPILTNDEIRTIIRESAEDQVGLSAEDTAGWDQYYGAGRLNAFNALSHPILNLETIATQNNDLSIYPNPIDAGEMLNFKSSSLTIKGVHIYNYLGEKCFELTSNSPNNLVQIKLPNLKSGIYVIEFFDELGARVALQKLLVE